MIAYSETIEDIQLKIEAERRAKILNKRKLYTLLDKGLYSRVPEVLSSIYYDPDFGGEFYCGQYTRLILVQNNC